MTARALRRDRYREWLEAQGLRFNFGAELAALADNVNKGVQNDTPSVEIWHVMLPTIRLVEKVREEFGPTTIRSGYRSPKYNASLDDSAELSLHMANKAIDFSCATGTPKAWAAYLRELRDAGVFTGGIGTYGTFVHVDTRGTIADWTGA